MKQKLQARRGATLTAALLFFLVAAVCGSIILAAATATLSRVKNQAKDTQAYYAVTSAAQLIRDDLMNSRWELKLTEEYEESSSKPISTVVTEVTLDESAQDTFVDDLIIGYPGDNKQLVKDAEIQISNTIGLPTIYAKANANADEMKLTEAGDGLTLKITLTNDTGSNRFSPASFRETDDSGNRLYWVTVELRSMRVPGIDKVESDNRVNGKGTVKRVIGLTWDDPVIKKLER